ncbi:hypothetical protein Leryth_002647, partial [Lithospermum erythrorhizon]
GPSSLLQTWRYSCFNKHIYLFHFPYLTWLHLTAISSLLQTEEKKDALTKHCKTAAQFLDHYSIIYVSLGLTVRMSSFFTIAKLQKEPAQISRNGSSLGYANLENTTFAHDKYNSLDFTESVIELRNTNLNILLSIQ